MCGMIRLSAIVSTINGPYFIRFIIHNHALFFPGGLVAIFATIHCLSDTVKTKFMWTYALLCLYSLYKVRFHYGLFSKDCSFYNNHLQLEVQISQRQLKLDGPRTGGEILDFWNYQRYQKSLITLSKHLKKVMQILKVWRLWVKN